METTVKTPAKPKWTEEQQQVIDLHNRNILVSAAAGSGKTAVLVERIMELISNEKEPVDIDQLVVVTFTNAAAREMKERILASIEKRMEVEPENLHLRRQQSLIEHAQITTIDSFCLNVIRNYFSEIDLDPGFKVADEGELKLMMADVMDSLLEECYENGSEEFYDFVECFTPEKTDSNLGEYILALYREAQSNPWPVEWLLQCKRNYQYNTVEEFLDSAPMKHLQEEIEKQISSVECLVQEMLQCANELDGPYMYKEAIQDDLSYVLKLKEHLSLAELYSIISNHTFARLSTKKDEKVSEDKKNAVKDMRDAVKKSLSKLKEDFLKEDWNDEFETMKRCGKHIETYVDLTIQFMERFDEQKKKKNVINFNDMEHLALNILVHKEDGELRYTPVADELSKRFYEILIDEYQDSNMVQELILNSVSTERFGHPNVFMVGDVKQSIYRFRLARPELFIEKYDSYSAEDGQYQKIELHHNFRSRSAVLESVNAVFDKIMRKDFGKVSYDENTRLYPAAHFDEVSEGKVLVGGRSKLLLLEHDDEGDMSDLEAETVVCADEIHRMINNRELCLDKETKTYRPVRYQDMVILMRSGKKNAETVVNTLAQTGIPSHAESQAGYFDAHEIVVVMHMLNVLDNPRQDISLASAMKSYFGGFTSNDLACIRGKFPDKEFYDAVVSYEALESELNGKSANRLSELQEKIHAFLELVKMYRQQMEYLTIHELLWNLVYDTGFYDYLGTMNLGEERQANIDMLIDKAKAYENTSFHGLFNFVRYMERLKDYEVDYGEASLNGENDNVVRIMTIHKSKGLEFPVVFLINTQKNFNQMDSNKKLILDADLGIGTDGLDQQKRTRKITAVKKSIAIKMRHATLSEEQRILYVAMTRAKEKLIVTGCVKDAQKSLENWKTQGKRRKLTYLEVIGHKNYLDMIMPAVLEDKSTFNYQVIKSDAINQLCENLESDCRKLEDDVKEKIVSKEIFQYPYNIVSMPVKMTVSELKYLSQEEEDEPTARLIQEEIQEGTPDSPALQWNPEEFVPTVPHFMAQEEGVFGAQRGSAYHKLMELLDYELCKDSASVERFIGQLVSEGKLSKEWADSIKVNDIVHFIQSELGQRFAKAFGEHELYRERQFVMSIPANKVDPTYDETHQVLVQGVVDAYFKDLEGIVLVDYKTDRVPKGQAGKTILLDKYKKQLEYYKEALERMTEQKVCQMFIYSFSLGESIEV